MHELNKQLLSWNFSISRPECILMLKVHRVTFFYGPLNVNKLFFLLFFTS